MIPAHFLPTYCFNESALYICPHDHGPEGLKKIAGRIHSYALQLSAVLERLGYKNNNKYFFDTLKITLSAGVSVEVLKEKALQQKINLRYFATGEVGVSIDETTTDRKLQALLAVFAEAAGKPVPTELSETKPDAIPASLKRSSAYLQQAVFSLYRSETDLMRYIKKLERRDISLAHSMWPADAFAADVAAFYTRPITLAGALDGKFSLGANISNIGSKVSYDKGNTKQFLPTNFRIGTSYEHPIDAFNTISINMLRDRTSGWGTTAA